MALKPCKECGETVSTYAKKCPSCGAKDPTGRAKKMFKIGCLTVLGSFALLIFVIVVVSNLEEGGGQKTGPVAVAKPEAPAAADTENGYTWNKTSAREKAAYAGRVVRALTGRPDPNLAANLVAGLDALYDSTNPDVLSQPLKAMTVALMVVVAKQKRGD